MGAPEKVGIPVERRILGDRLEAGQEQHGDPVSVGVEVRLLIRQAEFLQDGAHRNLGVVHSVLCHSNVDFDRVGADGHQDGARLVQSFLQ